MVCKSVALVVCAGSLLCSGCLLISVEKKTSPPPAPPAPQIVYVPAQPTTQAVITAADLQARYTAAAGISTLLTRDAVMAGLAADAASIGEVSMAKQALSQIASLSTRDNASESVALTLAGRGQRAEAADVARSISSLSQRDKTLAALASR